MEAYHDATFYKEGNAQELFSSGVLTLSGRAAAEQLYYSILNAVARVTDRDPERYEEIRADVEATLVDRYFCNFSLFQSLPDSWAINHLFPIMPIHRLGDEPTRRGTLQDITCDSDGKIDQFAGRGRGPASSLRLHPYHDGEDYILGIFLTGAYQEILGDLHNLFGDTNAVHMRLTADGYDVTDIMYGDTVTPGAPGTVLPSRARSSRHSAERSPAATALTRREGNMSHRRVRGGSRGVHLPGRRGRPVTGGCLQGLSLGARRFPAG